MYCVALALMRSRKFYRKSISVPAYTARTRVFTRTTFIKYHLLRTFSVILKNHIFRKLCLSCATIDLGISNWLNIYARQH